MDLTSLVQAIKKNYIIEKELYDEYSVKRGAERNRYLVEEKR